MAAPTIEVRPEFAGILRNDETNYVASDASVGNRINGWFDTLLVQSGLGISPTVMMFLSFLGGLALGGAAFVWQENPLTTAIGGGIGFLLPVLLVMFLRQRRQTTIMNQLPPMIDELARAAKTGRSIEHCFQLVAADTHAPLGSELQVCARRLELGLPMNEALSELPYRTGVVSTSVLTTALGVHQQTGGDLVRVLERLAITVRDRIQFMGRLRAATAASRYVAFLMLALPPAILAFFTFRDPDYLRNLMDSEWGRWTIISAVILEIVGVAWILRILGKSSQT